MKTPLSPSDIEVLIWCHSRPEPHPRLEAPAVLKAVEMFIASDMIRQSGTVGDIPYFTTTQKGRAMIGALCNTPEPRQIWVDAQGRNLLEDR